MPVQFSTGRIYIHFSPRGYVAVVIDPQTSGISGDMLLCGLVDLGADTSGICDAARTAEKHLDGSSISRLDFVKRPRHGITATCMIAKASDPEYRQGYVMRDCIKKSASEIGLSDTASQYALECIDTILSAESRIHGESVDSVHLHEAAGVDTAIDILGCAVAADELKLFDEHIYSTAVAVGGGTVSFSHGVASNPAPAILEILCNSDIRICGGSIADELTTPTGAALLRHLADDSVEFYPPLKISNTGYGGGSKDFESFANVLRITIGTEDSENDSKRDSIAILETNLDDVTGEVVGHVIDRAMHDGAYDITASPAITKKNRPAHVITIMCAEHLVPTMTSILQEAGTLGIRVRRSERFVVPRRIKTHTVVIDGTTISVRVKTDPSTGNILKLEFDDIRRASEMLGLSIRDTEQLIRDRIK